MILASGANVTVSDHENRDLFWAMKGAGANFGAVTSLTFKIYRSPNGGQVMSADMTFPSSQNRSIFEFAKSWIGRQPKELSMVYSILFDPAAQDFLIIINVIYAGPLSYGKNLIQPLLDLNPQRLNISYIPWKDAPDAASYGAPRKSCDSIGQTMIPFGVNLYDLDVNGLSALLGYLHQSIDNSRSASFSVHSHAILDLWVSASTFKLFIVFFPGCGCLRVSSPLIQDVQFLLISTFLTLLV